MFGKINVTILFETHKRIRHTSKIQVVYHMKFWLHSDHVQRLILSFEKYFIKTTTLVT